MIDGESQGCKIRNLGLEEVKLQCEEVGSRKEDVREYALAPTGLADKGEEKT